MAVRLRAIHVLPFKRHTFSRNFSLSSSFSRPSASDTVQTTIPPSPGPPASQVAEAFLAQVKDKSFQRTQKLDDNQLQRLCQTLGRPEVIPGISSTESFQPTSTVSIPPGYHLAYFTPQAFEQDLGLDGSDKTFNPGPPFTRRMWAGGEMTWCHDNPLQSRVRTKEHTKILSAIPKKTRDGQEMIVVGVEKTFISGQGVSLMDRRNWIFRPELTSSSIIQERGPIVPFPEKTDTNHIRDLIQTPVSLFRFSALTFNGHKIHYSLPWCREVEGHRGLVVHGPLNLINILDFWRDRESQKGKKFRFPASVKYRATSPIYADEPYRIVLDESETNVTGMTKAKIWTCDGKVGMEAEIQAVHDKSGVRVNSYKDHEDYEERNGEGSAGEKEGKGKSFVL